MLMDIRCVMKHHHDHCCRRVRSLVKCVLFGVGGVVCGFGAGVCYGVGLRLTQLWLH